MLAIETPIIDLISIPSMRFTEGKQAIENHFLKSTSWKSFLEIRFFETGF